MTSLKQIGLSLKIACIFLTLLLSNSLFAKSKSIVDFNESKVSIKLVKDIFVTETEDDVWIQDGRDFQSYESINSEQVYCEIDTNDKLNPDGRFLEKGKVYQVERIVPFDGFHNGFTIIIKDSFFEEIECNLPNNQKALSPKELNQKIANGILEFQVSK